MHDSMVVLPELPADAHLDHTEHGVAAATVTTNDPDGAAGLWSRDRVHRLSVRFTEAPTPAEFGEVRIAPRVQRRPGAAGHR